MFTGVAQKNLAVAKSYFDEHLSHNDYYTQGEVEQGKWLGLGCEALGLKEGQAADREMFMSLCDGLHPGDNSRLTQRLNGAGNRRVFYDFTCSAPKSVSLMAVTMKDERILRAHQEAARIGMKELEAYAATRIRVQGGDTDRRTGNVVGAEFLHNSSRSLDPQLHTHFTLFNATFDHTEKRWKALQTSDIFEASKYATEVYRNELAKRLAVIGYEVEKRADSFEIKGVPRELLKRFSKRSAERDQVIARMEERLGRKLDNNEVSVAVHRTRSRKLKGISTEEVRQIQLDQMTQNEIASLRAVQERANGPLHGERVEEHASLDYATAHVFERSSVVTQEELLRHALVHGRGQVALSLLKSQLEEERFVRVGGEISTREILTKELGLIEALDSTRASAIPLAPEFVPPTSLGEDQRSAITHVLQTSDQFTGFQGLAGAGKTTALQEIAQLFSREKRPALFCALSATAAQVLREEVSPQAVTLAKLLVDPRKQEGLKDGVIVLDEAGLVGLDDMHALFSLALEKNARIILSGDTGQHSGVARGDALRLLEEHSIYRSGHLDQIRRQQEAGYREVVELAASQHPQEALDRLDSLGKVMEPDRLYESAAGAFLEAREQGRSALLVAPTWAEIDSVTQCVRSQLQEKGLLSKKEESVPVFDALGWTEAQKSNPSLYAPGMRILFGQTSGHFRAHEEVEVVAITLGAQGVLKVRKEDGSIRSFRPRTGASFQVGERRELAIAPGDELLLQANRSKEGLLNGQVVTVKTVQEGKITLTDGRTLPSNYREFTHGYCVTSHSSQARTVDSVFLVASSRSAGAIHREQFYVSISRGRQECRVFTDDKELLRDRIARSTHRQAALDLLGEALRKEGLVPAISDTRGKRRGRKIPEEPSLKASRLRSLPNLSVQRTRDLERLSLQEHVIRLAQRTFQSLRDFSQKTLEARKALEAVPDLSPGHSHHITHDQDLPGRSQERSHSHDRGPSLER